MERKRGNKRIKRFLFMGIIVIVVLITIAIASFIFSSKDLEIKKILFELASSLKQDTSKSELSSVSPLSKPKYETEKAESKEGTSGGGGGGGGGDGSGVSSSKSVGGVEKEEKSESAIGVLSIDNIIDVPYTSSDCRLVHYPEATEGYNDDYDGWYYPMFNPSGVASKIISKVDLKELDVDSRPEDSTTTFYLELSIISQRGGTIKISSNNELRISMPLAEYNFGNKQITLQQYDPSNPSVIYPAYDVNKLIAEGNGVGIVKLPNLNGTYVSATPYAYFKLMFE